MTAVLQMFATVTKRLGAMSELKVVPFSGLQSAHECLQSSGLVMPCYGLFLDLSFLFALAAHERLQSSWVVLPGCGPFAGLLFLFAFTYNLCTHAAVWLDKRIRKCIQCHMHSHQPGYVVLLHMLLQVLMQMHRIVRPSGHSCNRPSDRPSERLSVLPTDRPSD